MVNGAFRLYTTKEASDQIGRSKATLLRWIAKGSIEDVKQRDDNNYRIWTESDVKRFIVYKNELDKIKKRKRSAPDG